MAQAIVDNFRTTGGNALMQELSRLAGDQLYRAINNLSVRQVEGLINQLGNNINNLRSHVVDRIRTAISSSDIGGQLSPQARSDLEQSSIIQDRREGTRGDVNQRQSNTREGIQNQNRQLGEGDYSRREGNTNKLTETREAMDADTEGQDGMAVGRVDAGVSGGVGSGGHKDTGESFMVTPDNRKIGPGIFSKYAKQREQFTIETSRLNSGQIELNEGKFVNLLCQYFTDPVTDEVIDLANNTSYPNPVDNREYEVLVGYPHETMLNHISISKNNPLNVVYHADDLLRNDLQPSGHWSGYTNWHGFKEGTFGGFPLDLVWKLHKNKGIIQAMLEAYDFIKLDNVEFIISDVYAWNVNQISQNITHALTPDVGTILEVPVEPQRLVRADSNVKCLGDKDETKTFGLIWPHWRREVITPVLKQMVHNEKVLSDWQTGWTGGNYTKTLIASNGVWFPTTKSTEDMVNTEQLSNWMGINTNSDKFLRYQNGRGGLFFARQSSEPWKYDRGDHYTLLDLDQKQRDYGAFQIYAPYRDSVARLWAGQWKGVDDPHMGAQFGALAMNDLNTQLQLYMRRKTPSTNTRAYFKYTLQVRATYSVSYNPLMIDRNNEFQSTNDMNGVR